MRSIITAAATLGALLFAAPVFADEPPPAPAPSHQYDVHPNEQLTETRWYGWQNLLVDTGSVGVMLGAAKSDSLGWIGLAGYVLGSPIVHLAHERGGAAAAALGMRVAFPIAGALIASSGCSKQDHEDDFGCLGPALVGIGVGALLAMAIDDFALSHEEVRKQPEFSVVPSTSIVRSPDGKSSTPTFGVSGVF
jgi:hypothetical protein